MDSLKDASNDLLAIFLPDGGTGTTKIRIGMAPFDAGVNAGSYASSVSGWTSDTCIYERLNAAYDGTDEFPSGISRLKSKADISGAKTARTLPKLFRSPLTSLS